MPVSVEFLRGVLGVLSALFGHFLGRTMVKVQKGKAPKRALYTWALRFILSVVAVCYLAVDLLALIVLVLDAVVFGLGWWDEWRPKHEEDLTRTMFSDDH